MSARFSQNWPRTGINAHPPAAQRFPDWETVTFREFARRQPVEWHQLRQDRVAGRPIDAKKPCWTANSPSKRGDQQHVRLSMTSASAPP